MSGDIELSGEDYAALVAERDRLAAELAEAKTELDVEVIHGRNTAGIVTNILMAEREAHAKTRANADHLRSMVGECHLMISRNTPEFQLEKAWESTTLPPRVQKVMQRASRAEGILRELRAWLEMIEPTHWVSPGHVLAKLDELEKRT